MGPRSPRPYRRALIEALACTVVAVVVYGLLRQEVFWKSDGPYLVLALADGRCAHPYNAGYMPLLFGFAALLAPLGLSSFGVASWFSVAGTALAVGIAQLAFARLGMSVRRSFLATVLFATTPAVTFFATVVEHHGPFLPFAALSFLIAVEFARRPDVLLAFGLGVATHVAYVVHGTGNLLPGLLYPLILAWRSSAGTLRHDLVLLAGAGAVHLGLFALLLEFELGGATSGAQKVAAILEEGIGGPRGLAVVPTVVARELLLPFAPGLVAAVLALGGGRGRRGSNRSHSRSARCPTSPSAYTSSVARTSAAPTCCRSRSCWRASRRSVRSGPRSSQSRPRSRSVWQGSAVKRP